MIFSLRFCTDADRRIGSLDDIQKHSFFFNVDWNHLRDRPAAYQPRVKAIDDTSNFDEFPDVELRLRTNIDSLIIFTHKSLFFLSSASATKDSGTTDKDWFFINYTYRHFDGLTAKPNAKTSGLFPSSN